MEHWVLAYRVCICLTVVGVGLFVVGIVGMGVMTFIRALGGGS